MKRAASQVNFEASPAKQLMQRQLKGSFAEALPAVASPFDYRTLLLCLETANLFDSCPQLKLQQVCRDLRYRYLEHLNRLCFARFRSLRPELVYKPPLSDYSSLLFKQSNLEDAAIRFAQLCPGSSPAVIFGPLDKLPLRAWPCASVLQKQLRLCAQTNNIHAWNRLFSLAFVQQQCYGHDVFVLGQFYYEVIYDILATDHSHIFMDLCNVLFSKSTPINIQTAKYLHKTPGFLMPLLKCPLETLSLLANCETKLNCLPQQLRHLDFFLSDTVWSSVSNSLEFKTVAFVVNRWNTTSSVFSLVWIYNSAKYLLKNADVAFIETGFLDTIVSRIIPEFRKAHNPQKIEHTAVLQALKARLK